MQTPSRTAAARAALSAQCKALARAALKPAYRSHCIPRAAARAALRHTDNHQQPRANNLQLAASRCKRLAAQPRPEQRSAHSAKQWPEQRSSPPYRSHSIRQWSSQRTATAPSQSTITSLRRCPSQSEKKALSAWSHKPVERSASDRHRAHLTPRQVCWATSSAMNTVVPILSKGMTKVSLP